MYTEMKIVGICTLLFVGELLAALPPPVTDKELQTLSETLLKKDVNNAAKFIKINYQARTRSNSLTDAAPLPLISVDKRVFQLPTVAKVRMLYDNYVADTSVNEHVTAQERAEESSLLDTFLATPVMSTAMRFLADHGLVRRDPKAYKNLLNQIWFGMYSRGGGRVGSSAFEHVFLGELKRGEISGLHNWIFFNNEEILKHADYLGYIRKLELGDKGAILKLHYKWENVIKPVGSMFVGTSPELEMALYTVCFIARPNQKCSLSLSGKRVFINTHTFRYRGKNMIGSAYPEI
ncbi:endoribonuclease CG2145-like isoform X1 [Schistocerca nitens]|uniref:endoribonuclease CG2145-like isoform X1 n=1 Tax=Schistocerca nitens TaxID=7011 RepID=UPI002117ED16|nr:endoribonuclease CG2145-like isoform X1 [Schistocerca nitens]